MSKQESLFNFYLNHQEELLKEYKDKYLVLKEEGVVGAYDSAAAAVHYSRDAYAPGSFIIQLCTPGDSAYTIHTNSRILIFPTPTSLSEWMSSVSATSPSPIPTATQSSRSTSPLHT